MSGGQTIAALARTYGLPLTIRTVKDLPERQAHQQDVYMTVTAVEDREYQRGKELGDSELDVEWCKATYKYKDSTTSGGGNWSWAIFEPDLDRKAR